MQQLLVGGTWEEVRQIARDLFEHGERCAEAGLLQQAQALLAQAWSVAAAHDVPLADSAAWSLAWVLIRQEAYAEARNWFQRVREPPAVGRRTWGQIRHALDGLCHLAQPLHVPATPATAAPLIRITSLGVFRVTRGDVPLPPCRSRRAITLLRYLLTCPYRSATREELIELLWPESDPRNALHNLHVAVSALRDYLGPDGAQRIRYEGGCYRLNPDLPISDDVSVFLQLCAEGDHSWKLGDYDYARRVYSRALALYRGDYVIDGIEHPRLTAERERLLNCYLHMLQRLGRAALATGEADLALHYFQTLIDKDPYREDVVVHLLHCYIQLGRRSEALRYYRRFVELLRCDLNLEVTAELQRVGESICEPEDA
jgi:DNA-binding SARP family transcriptional activator